jgi:hypothetical protein
MSGKGMALATLVLGCALMAACSGRPGDPHGQVEPALANVCTGQGVSEAAAYARGGAPHPIVLLSESGEHHEWSDSLPAEWYPAGVSDAQLVACIGAETQQTIEVCHYNGPDITRYTNQLAVRLVEARNGRTIASQTFTGDPPRECRQTEDYDLTRLEGPEIDLSVVQGWLSSYVLSSGGASMIDDFEAGNLGWSGFSDRPESFSHCGPDRGRRHSGAFSLRFEYNVATYGWVNCGWYWDPPQNWSSGTGLAFWITADRQVQEISLALDSGGSTFDIHIDPDVVNVAGWQRVTAPWSMFERAEWDTAPGGLDTLDTSAITGMVFGTYAGETENPGIIWIDDLQVNGQ